MKSPFLRYAITDRFPILHDSQTRHQGIVTEAQQRYLTHQAERLAAEGVDFLQLREKDLTAADIAALARTLLHTLRGSSTRLLINARADIAVAAGAHGVHLTSSPDELTPLQVHDLYARAGLPAPLVTKSCHTLDDVERCRLEPVTAILFGPVFEKIIRSEGSNTPESRLEGIGLDSLRRACQTAAPIPVLALGGIDSSNLPACIDAGARGAAGIRIFQKSL